jgi:hypothetical protein
MVIDVLIEPVAANGYRASGGGPFSALSAEGGTREEAMRKLRELIEAKLKAGSQVARLEIKQGEHPLAKFAGTWQPDEKLLEEWKQAVEDYRRQVDEDPDTP